jgi:hypothetical protein
MRCIFYLKRQFETLFMLYSLYKSLIMSNLLKFSLLFLGLFAASFSAVAQSDKRDDGRRQGYWFLGLNSGGAWQQSDIKAAAGGGLGLYLGGNLFYRKTSPISLDLRFRYLYTATYGQDWRLTAVTGSDLLGGNYFDNSFFGNGISSSKNYTPSGGGLGFAYMNNETDFHDLSLELRLNFETLRRKYRVWFSLYAGAGVGFYNTHFDQLNERSNSIDPDLYRYENINSTGSASAIRSSIYSMRDDIYETDVTQGFNAGFMTHAGFELGYWITPRFAIGVGHRVTWTLRDDFDGFRSTARSRNDIHHYANLFLHFDLYSGRARINTNGNINNNTNINTNVVVTAPRVAFSFPNCPYSTQSAVTTIRVNITEVTSSENINLTINGTRITNFRYNSTTGVLETTIALVAGSNAIFVSATNSGGTASSSCNIVYTNEPVPVVRNPPTVNITYPSNNLTVNTNLINVFANVTNVSNISQVTYTVNGAPSRNFTLNGNSFVANNTALVVGSNTIIVSATNPDGSASDTRVVIYNQPNQPPVVVKNPPTVQITNPSANPFTTNNSSINIGAITSNINNANQITFTVNGQITRNFSFNGNSILANNINLVQGNNNINIVVTNADGTASDNTTIIYRQPEPVVVQNPPTVQITNPSANPFTTNSSTVNISAQTTNINSSNQITFTVNGQITRNFSFSGNRINANGINLVQGNNNINIVVTNADGTASDNTTIIYRQPEPVVVQNPPTVQITNPSANPFNTTNNVANISAQTTNIVRSNQITFTLNGRNVTNFTFNNGTINSPLVLQQGANNIVIRVENNDGNASDQTLINYSLPCQQPTIAVQSPANTNSNSVSIQANMTNISQVSQVRFTVNGQANSNFSLRNGNFTANVSNLQQGANSFTLSATNDCGTASENFTVTYNIPAPVVVRTPPTVNITNPAANPFNSSSSTTNINATITNVNSVRDVTFTINGQASTNFSLRGTAFAASNVSLVSGNNTVVITGTNPDGTASDQTTIVYNAPCPQPTIALLSPATNSSVNTASVDAQATFVGINNKNQVAFTVNGRKADFNFSTQGANGSFSTTVNGLQQGANTLVISVTNNCGTATQTFTVTYNAPAPVVVPTPPTVNITNPSSDPFTSSSDNVNINATITNVSSMRGVTFTVNGQANSNFSLRGTSFAAMNVSLNNGRNTIVITGTNPDGTASDQTVVIYNAPVVVPTPPTVQITSPSGNPFSSPSDQINIAATITNVATSTGVTFTVNGRRNTNFSLLGNRFTANNVALQQGNNDIVITGTNPDGTASDQTVIIYKQTAPPPTVDITTPNTNPFNTSNNSENINATVTNVASANDITFLVNGQRVNNFSLRGTNFSANNVSLNAGRNTIEVRADNGVSQASEQTVIIYNQPVPPTVNITNPSSNPSNVTTDVVNIAADIRNVSSASEVTFTVNGSRISNFNLRGTGFNASNVRLQAGSNTVIITATTPAGSASDQTTIIYTAPAPQPADPQPIISNMNALQQQVRGATNTYVTAQIAHVSNASGIVFTANGQRITNFTFNNGNFRADNVPVQNGVNTYTITATNSAGSATMSAALNYSSGNTGGGNQNRTTPAPNTNPNNTNGRTIAPTEKNTGTDEENKTEENKTDNKGGKMERKNTTPPTPPNKGSKMGGE